MSFIIILHKKAPFPIGLSAEVQLVLYWRSCKCSPTYICTYDSNSGPRLKKGEGEQSPSLWNAKVRCLIIFPGRHLYLVHVHNIVNQSHATYKVACLLTFLPWYVKKVQAILSWAKSTHDTFFFCSISLTCSDVYSLSINNLYACSQKGIV